MGFDRQIGIFPAGLRKNGSGKRRSLAAQAPMCGCQKLRHTAGKRQEITLDKRGALCYNTKALKERTHIAE